MGKNKIASAASILARKKRHFQGYFDLNDGSLLTPNQRSLAKDKKLFYNRSKKKSNKKAENNISKRLSNPKIDPKKQKETFSPIQKPVQKSNHKASRFEHSINKEYDSPSKEHEQIDFIFQARKKMKGNSAIQSTIEKVEDYLKMNRLDEAIDLLLQAKKVEPNNYDLLYLLGICYIFNNSYEQAITIFQNLLQAKPRKNIYLLLSVCYKRTDQLFNTENILEQCIKKFPKYFEAYIYRGKLLLKQKQFKKALQDFEKAISLDSQKQIGLIGRGDSLRLMERYEEARKCYTHALSFKKNDKNYVSLLLRRAICSMEVKKFEAALEDINTLLELDFQNSQALYFKGLIFNKLQQQNEAIICYQQAIKHNSNKRAVTRSIYEITKIKIEHRDYYEALYTLERAQYLDIDEKVIRKFKIFTEGVTSLMKKNYDQGIKTLTELQKDQEKPLSGFLKPLLYSTRSYGFMALEKYQNAKEDLDIMEREYSLDLPNMYNKFICEGILACNNQRYQSALALFSKAGKALPYRLQPAFYKAVTLICFSTKLIPKEMVEKKKEYIESAMKTVNKVEAKIQNNPSLYMVRGLLYYALNKLPQALDDFDKCWTESTKPNALVSYMTGLIFAEQGRYNDAISQFNRTIEHDERHKIPEAYLNRAKCMILISKADNGFVDLQSYMTYKPSSPQIHIFAGHFLCHINAHEDAAKAYSNINNINKNFEVLFYRASCYLVCKDVLNTISNLKSMLDIRYDNATYFDLHMLECLRECSDQNMSDYGKMLLMIKQTKKKTSLPESRFGNIFHEPDYQFYKGLMYFYDGKYLQAGKNFKRALDLTEEDIKRHGQDDVSLIDFYRMSFNNRCFNYFEILYNMAICEIKFGNLAKALKIIKSTLDKIQDSELKNQFELFANLLSNQIANQFNRQHRGASGQEEAEFLPFPVENRLCSIFPEILLPFSTPVRTRLFFCLPYVRKPDITPKFQEKILEQVDMASIEIKPEAPWIRRSEQGIIFTDEVIRCDISLSQSSQENDEQIEEDDADLHDEERNVDDQENQDDLDNQNDFQGAMNPDQLRQFFSLDKKTAEKLQRLANNKK